MVRAASLCLLATAASTFKLGSDWQNLRRYQEVLRPIDHDIHLQDVYKVRDEYGFASESRPSYVSIANLKSRLKKAEIIPTVVDEFLPSFLLDVKWSSDEYADLGNTLKLKKLQDAPSISFESVSESTRNSNVTYTITLTDPDAPSRDNPKWAEMCHWIMIGVTASSSSYDVTTLTDTEEIIPYKPPGPPKKTGKHRYVFLVLVPANGTTDILNLTKPDDRQHWGTGKERHGVRDWADDNGLIPVAANFIYAQHKKQ